MFESLAVGETATDTFTYTITDGTSTSTATVTVTIQGANDLPTVSGSESLITNEDAPATSLDLLSNASDVDTSDVLNVTNLTLVAGDDSGITVNGNSLDIDPAAYNGLGAGDVAVIDYTYHVVDGNGGTIPQMAKITINGVDDPAVAVDDTATTNEDVAVPISVLTNDSDADDGESPVLDTFDVTSMNGGMVTNTAGILTYTPAANFNGTDTFTYTLVGGAIATVTVTVDAVNDAPVAVNDTVETDEGTPLNGDVLVANAIAPATSTADSDAEGDALSVFEVNGSPSNVGVPIPTTNGMVTVNINGTFTYTPTASVEGPATDSFTYAVEDGNGGVSNIATVNININAVNDPPVANDDTLTLGENDPATTINVLSNDTDPDNSPTIQSADATGTGGGSITVAGDNLSVDYDPNGAFESLAAGETATDTFTYTITDGTDTSTATVTVTIQGANDAPVAMDDADTATDDGVAATGNVLGNDTDVDASNTLSVVAPGTYTGSHGDLTLNVDGSYSYVVTDESIDDGDPPITDTFMFDVTDGTVNVASQLVITVNGQNDPPVAVDDNNTASDDGVTVSGDVLANDSDADASDMPEVANPGTIIGTYGTLTLNMDGTYDYVVTDESLPVGASVTDTFGIDVTDGDATVSSNLIIAITGLNDAPVAVNDAFTTNEDTSFNGNVLVANPTATGTADSDVEGDALSVFEVNGSPSNVGVAVPTTNGGTVTVNVNGTFSYTPAADFQGPTDTFSYAIEDTNGGVSDVAAVTINITAVNDAPIANDDSETTAEETPVVVDLTNNDTDIDGTIDDASIILGTPGNGSVVDNGDGTVTYTPALNFFGTDTFTYTVEDDLGLISNVSTVTITVNDVNATGPQVVDVFVDSTEWSSSFRDFADNGFADPSAMGYRIPKGAAQLETLPWININIVRVKFSEDVASTIDVGDFDIVPAAGFLAFNAGGPAGPLPGIDASSFTYDASTFTASFEVDFAFETSVLDLQIASLGVQDSIGNHLDGDWDNGSRLGNSGNNVAGGDFSFRMFVLPGDVSGGMTTDGARVTASNDLDIVRSLQNDFVFNGSASAGYNLRADLDGHNSSTPTGPESVINATDLQAVRARQNAFIFGVVPPPPPAFTAISSASFNFFVEFESTSDADGDEETESSGRRRRSIRQSF